MNICFFGTGHGVPEAHKKCSSALLQVNDAYYLIDAGCDVAYELAQKRVPVEKLKAVFITHADGDHIQGLIPLLSIVTNFYTNAKPAVFLPSEKTRQDFVQHVLPGMGIELLPGQTLHAYQSGVVYDDGIIKVSAFQTKHRAASYAFLIEAEGKRVLFSGDLMHPSIDFPPVDDLDAAILEGAHFFITDYAEVLRTKTVKAAYINHYGNYIGCMNHHNLKPLQEALPQMHLELATDGMEISV